MISLSQPRTRVPRPLRFWQRAGVFAAYGIEQAANRVIPIVGSVRRLGVHSRGRDAVLNNGDFAPKTCTVNRKNAARGTLGISPPGYVARTLLSARGWFCILAGRMLDSPSNDGTDLGRHETSVTDGTFPGFRLKPNTGTSRLSLGFLGFSKREFAVNL